MAILWCFKNEFMLTGVLISIYSSFYFWNRICGMIPYSLKVTKYPISVWEDYIAQ